MPGARTAQAQPQTCQVPKLVLGPLHLDLLGLAVDLYGKTRSDLVIITISPPRASSASRSADSPGVAASQISPA